MRHVIPRAPRRAGWLALIALTAALGCQRPAPTANLLLVVIDTLRADRLGAYGYERPSSPYFDILASQALLFEHAYSTTSWTNPAMAALFTGAPPRVLQPGAARFIESNQPTLAKVLRQNGYRTAAFVANPVLGPQLGFADGFETYEGLAGWAQGLEQRDKQSAEPVTEAALGWLQQARSSKQPWFLYVHYMDPHWPYQPPGPALRPFWPGELPTADAMALINKHVRERQYSDTDLVLARALYDGSIRNVDMQVARLLQVLGEPNSGKTIVAITADHGEELGDHGNVLHARTLYDEVLRVPLAILGTDKPAQLIKHTVQTCDLARTLLDCIGLNAVEFSGRSILQPRDRPLIAQLHPGPATAHRAAVIERSHKLIRTQSGESLLFDLGIDPGERQNLASDESAARLELEAFLPSATPGTQSGTAPTTDPAVAERMRALGYDF